MENTSPLLLEDGFLAISLQLEDIEHTRSTQLKGKQREGCISDDELAFDIFTNVLQSYEQTLHDKQLAESIAKAVNDDSDLILSLMEDEARARNDHEEAVRLSGSNINTSCPSTPEILPTSIQFEDIPLPALEEDVVAGPSQPYHARQKSAHEYFSTHKVTCAACTDKYRVHEAVHAPCSHWYCRECIKKLFVRATTDESLYPPRCCKQAISLDAVKWTLTTEELEAFNNSVVEFESESRIYCIKPDCGKFIPPENIKSDQGTCSACGTNICIHCRAEYHVGRACPKDINLQLLLQTAEKRHWQSCFRCGNMVELGTGCHHMTLVFSPINTRIQSNNGTPAASAVHSSATCAEPSGRSAVAKYGMNTDC
jgi:hypothetical protein